MTVLEKIIQHKKTELQGAQDTALSSEGVPKSQRNFFKFLQNPGKKWPRVIAEIKKQSPSRGSLFPEADIQHIAQIYQEQGGAAISVLTDEAFFGGSLQDLKDIADQSRIPVLRKDFFLQKSQILEARQNGADAILLMVSVLKDAKLLQELREYAESMHMHALVETHDEDEINIALESGAKIIGVNARDFTDLSINLESFQRLLPLIPDHIIKVAESGLEEIEEVQKVAPLCDAILVGTNFMKLANYEKIEVEVQKFTQA